MKHIFIINPTAGKGKSLELVPFIKEYFEDNAEEYVIKVTLYPGHATHIAREYSTSENCRIYSVGGDGTINEIVNGMAGTESSLGVIPTGSGNDFIRSFQEETDIKKLLVNTINGDEKRIDLARVNEKYFLNISSIGFDANVVYNSDKFKKLPGVSGSMAYLISIIYSVFEKKICDVNIDIDGNKMKKKVLLAAIANGKYYGGGIIPTPDAKIDDGLFDICLVSDMSRFQILRLFPKYIKGLHGQLKQASFFKAKKITIESEDDLCVNIDGELMSARIINFEILEKAIKVVFPAKEVRG